MQTWITTLLTCLHDQNKSGVMEGRQSEQSENILKIPDWLEKKPALQISHFCVDHVNRLYQPYIILLSLVEPRQWFVELRCVGTSLRFVLH